MSAEPIIDLSAVRKFINTELLYREDQQIDPGTNLIENGVIDSVTLLRLISFLEENYNIGIPDHEIVPDNFRSMSAIEKFLTAHVGAPQSGQMAK